MSEEEKEAIERSKKWIEFYRLREKTNYDFLFSIKENDIPINEIETVLNLIDKLENENFNLKEKEIVNKHVVPEEKNFYDYYSTDKNNEVKEVIKEAKKQIEDVHIKQLDEISIEGKEYISKDKIREVLEEIDKEYSETLGKDISLELHNINAERHYAMKLVLEEILGED